MIRRLAILLEIIRESNTSVGKTLLQKVIFVLQEWLDVKLEYDYRLHYYGPYSAALSDDIDSLDELGLAQVRPSCSGYGYDIELTDAGRQFMEAHPLDPFELGKVDTALAVYSSKSVRQLELTATILYFAKQNTDVDEIARLVAVVKPHFSRDEVVVAFDQLRHSGKLALG